LQRHVDADRLQIELRDLGHRRRRDADVDRHRRGESLEAGLPQQEFRPIRIERIPVRAQKRCATAIAARFQIPRALIDPACCRAITT
jgi:hypothetical protein